MTKWILLLLIVLAAVAQAQEQAEPHAQLRADAGVEAVELNGTATFDVAFGLDLGYLVCQGGFSVPLEVTLSAPEGVEATASDAEALFEGAIARVNYPYNYHGEGSVNVSLSGRPATNGTAEVAVSYDGSLPSNCQTTGPLPTASNTTSIDVYAPEVDTGPEASATQGSTSDPTAADPADATTPGLPAALVCAALALVARARRN